MYTWEWTTKNGITFITIPGWQQRGVDAAFSTRLGGASQAPYQSLNLGLHVGDEKETVLENRRQFLKIFDRDLSDLVCSQQVHGSRVVRVDEKHRGSGAFSIDTAIPDCDGMVTSTSEAYLATFYADCLPIYFFDPVRRAIGMAHSGWKGTMGRVATNTLYVMQHEFGCLLENIEVFIGPGIGCCCFEIQSDLAAKVNAEFKELNAIILKRNDDIYTWDLQGTNRQLLINCGVMPDNIIVCDLCTACHIDKFYSYRRERGKTGRMGAILGLKY